MSDLNENDQLEVQFQQRQTRLEQLNQQCQYRSVVQLAREQIRQARQNHNVKHYLMGTFELLRSGSDLLDPDMSKQAAIELILLLQDEEQARRIQPDLDEGEYHWICAWMTSCAYDNLAEATGMMSGYNSPGMHECIADGIQICRQTGKLECIRCFREYAATVYTASEDLAMVRYQCQAAIEQHTEDSTHDRRSTSLKLLSFTNLLEGRIDQARKDLEKALEFSRGESIYNPLRLKSLLYASLHEIDLLQGKTTEFAPAELNDLNTDEWPFIEYRLATLEALALDRQGKINEAIEILTEWDRRLTEYRQLDLWFEVRLRLISAYLREGQTKRAHALAKGLEAKASEAQDYLTLKRLARLTDPNSEPYPVPLLAASSTEELVEETVIEENRLPEFPMIVDDDDQEVAESDGTTPLSKTLNGYMRRITENEESPEKAHELLLEMISHSPTSIQSAADAAYLIHLSRYVILNEDDAQLAWPWALSIQRHFLEDATVLNVVAFLGYFLKKEYTETFLATILAEELEKWFRLSMTMNPNHPRNHSRAGFFFLGEGQLGEAERSFSRAFRLDRSDGITAHQLAEIYRETERPRDAMNVLDMCLRKGSRDSNVAWEAAMTALQLQQYDVQLTYLDRHQQLAHRIQTWHHYYRAIACFHLGRYDECLEELNREIEKEPLGMFHIHAVRVCVYTETEHWSLAQQELEKLLEITLATVDYLSFHGMVRASEMLCTAIEKWPPEDGLRQQLVLRLLRSGLLSDTYFEQLRFQEEDSNDIHFYRIQLQQTLDEDWAKSEGCLPGQQDWTEYHIDWGVLAEDQEEAINRVLEFQQQCELALPLLVHIDESEDTYRDKPGVVWQGYRRNDPFLTQLLSEEEDEDDDDEEDNDEDEDTSLDSEEDWLDDEGLDGLGDDDEDDDDDDAKPV